MASCHTEVNRDQALQHYNSNKVLLNNFVITICKLKICDTCFISMSTSAFAQNRDKQYDFTTYDLQGNNIGGDTVTANNLSRQFGMQLREAKAFGLGVRKKRNSCEYGTIDMRQYPNYINPS